MIKLRNLFKQYTRYEYDDFNTVNMTPSAIKNKMLEWGDEGWLCQNFAYNDEVAQYLYFVRIKR